MQAGSSTKSLPANGTILTCRPANRKFVKSRVSQTRMVPDSAENPQKRLDHEAKLREKARMPAKLSMNSLPANGAILKLRWKLQ